MRALQPQQPGVAPKPGRRRQTLMVGFNILVWLGLSVLSVWRASAGSVFFAFFSVFAMYRLVSEIAVATVDRLSIGARRPEALAAWLFVGRTAVTGAVVFIGSIVAIVLHPQAPVVVLGVCGILIGHVLLIFGIRLLLKLNRAGLSRSSVTRDRQRRDDYRPPG